MGKNDFFWGGKRLCFKFGLFSAASLLVLVVLLLASVVVVAANDGDDDVFAVVAIAAFVNVPSTVAYVCL